MCTGTITDAGHLSDLNGHPLLRHASYFSTYKRCLLGIRNSVGHPFCLLLKKWLATAVVRLKIERRRNVVNKLITFHSSILFQSVTCGTECLCRFSLPISWQSKDKRRHPGSSKTTNHITLGSKYRRATSACRSWRCFNWAPVEKSRGSRGLAARQPSQLL